MSDDDERHIYLSPEERKAAQGELNVIRRQSLDQIAEMSRVATLETALRTIQSAVAGYVHPERKVSAEELIDVVLKEADSVTVNKALEGKK